jgi:hypothetical protein
MTGVMTHFKPAANFLAADSIQYIKPRVRTTFGIVVVTKTSNFKPGTPSKNNVIPRQ